MVGHKIRITIAPRSWSPPIDDIQESVGRVYLMDLASKWAKNSGVLLQ